MTEQTFRVERFDRARWVPVTTVLGVEAVRAARRAMRQWPQCGIRLIRCGVNEQIVEGWK